MPDYVQLVLPMEYESSRHCDTMIGFSDPRRSEGELLFPERWGSQRGRQSQARHGEVCVGWAVSAAAGAARRRHLSIFGMGVLVALGRCDLRAQREPVSEMDMVVASLDSAYGEKQGKRLFCACCGRGLTNHRGVQQAILMEAWQKRLPINDLVLEVVKTCRKKRVDRLLIELKASGISVAQEVQRLTRDEEFAVQRIDPGNMDKVSRAHALSHLWARRRRTAISGRGSCGCRRRRRLAGRFGRAIGRSWRCRRWLRSRRASMTTSSMRFARR